MPPRSMSRSRAVRRVPALLPEPEGPTGRNLNSVRKPICPKRLSFVPVREAVDGTLRIGFHDHR